VCAVLKVEYGDLDSRTLVLQVYDYDRFSADEMIGQVTYPLSQNDVTRVQNEWRDLQTSSSDDQVLSFDLNHLPRGARGGGGFWHLQICHDCMMRPHIFVNI